MRRLFFLLTLILSDGIFAASEALAAPATAPSSLIHDGYRLSEVAPALARPGGALANNGVASCGAHPPAPRPLAGDLSVEPLVKDRFFNKFFQGNGRLYRFVAQHQGIPRAVVIRSGHWTLPRLAERLSAEPGVLTRKGASYLLRLPLLLQSGVALMLTEGETLRLSRDSGSFLISMGALHMDKARLEAWDEGRQQPAEVAGDTSFQPFIVAWSGSMTSIRNSTIAGLGFEEALARGLTVATGPLGLANYTLPPPGRLLIQGSRFEGMFSAIQATDTRDLRLCDTLFTDSRKYALHLEEGSGGLVQGNRITGTQGPYAVYLSGVQGVRLLRNEIYENLRSGVAITDSHDITLAGNTVRQNFDAIFVQGTEQAILVDNHILDNQRHGLSLRNIGGISLQGDHIGPNRGVGVLVLPEDKSQAPSEGLRRPSYWGDAPPAGHGQGAVVKATAEMRGSSKARPPLPSLSAAPFSPPLHDAVDSGKSADQGRAASQADTGGSRRKATRRLELKDVVLEGNHSSALVVERPYAVLLDGVDILYPGVRRRPVFRGVLNTFEADILKRLAGHRSLLVEPYRSPLASDKGQEERRSRKP